MVVQLIKFLVITYAVTKIVGLHVRLNSAKFSLDKGQWVKLICGASNTDVPLIRNLCYIYTIAGVDCIDLSTDSGVLTSAREGIESAMLNNRNTDMKKPLMMISVNDYEDPHFRKAVFDVTKCPATCPRPCESVCPAFAIPSLKKNEDAEAQKKISDPNAGVIAERCYGCGRCLTVCPLGLINAEAYQVQHTDIQNILTNGVADAVEIHTLDGHLLDFDNLWKGIGTEVALFI